MRYAEVMGRLTSCRSRDVANYVSTARSGFPQGNPLPSINVLVITPMRYRSARPSDVFCVNLLLTIVYHKCALLPELAISHCAIPAKCPKIRKLHPLPWI